MKIFRSIQFVLVLFIATMCKMEQTENPVSAIKKNYKPIIYKIAAKDTLLFGRLSTKLTCLASDLDNDNLKFTWSSKTGFIEGSGPIVKWTAPNNFGFQTVNCNVNDGKGGEATDSVKIFVNPSPNLAPSIRAFYATKDSINIGESTTIVCDAEDIDGDKLNFFWQLSSQGELVSTIGNVATYKGVASGLHRIWCYVSDPTHTVASYKIIYVK